MNLMNMSEEARESILKAVSMGGLSLFNVYLPAKATQLGNGKYVLVNGAGAVLGTDGLKPEDAPAIMQLEIQPHVRPALMSSPMSASAVNGYRASGLQRGEGSSAFADRAYGGQMDIWLCEPEWMPSPPNADGQGEDALEYGRAGYAEPYYGTGKQNSAGQIVYADRYQNVLAALIDIVLTSWLQNLPAYWGIEEMENILMFYAGFAVTSRR